MPIAIFADARFLAALGMTQGRSLVRQYFVYMMTNASRTLYVGVTNNLERRVSEHNQKLVPGFTSRYNITRLVYAETYPDPRSAIAREADQGVAPVKKGRADRGGESDMAGSE